MSKVLKIGFILLIHMFLSEPLKGQDVDFCKNCTIENLGNLRSGEKLSREELDNYFNCFKRECNNNVEYSTARDFTLFLILQAHPDEIVTYLEESKSNINLNLILIVLENPVSDQINVHKTLESVNGVPDGFMKTQLLESLNVAQVKVNNNVTPQPHQT